VQLGFVAGTIPVDKLAAFERLLFRATRGNMFLKFTPVSEGLAAWWCWWRGGGGAGGG
jgi:V-type H+-transporting ATPase subunit a